MEIKSGQKIRITAISVGERKTMIAPLLVNGNEVCAAFGSKTFELKRDRIQPDTGDADFKYDGELSGAIFVPKKLWL